MVQINLLPATAKKKKKLKVELKIKLRPLVFVLGALVLAIIVTLAILGMRLTSQRRELTKLDEQLGSSKASLEKLAKLKKDKTALEQRLEFMDRNLKRKVLWARNLNQISNLVPVGIWLKNITLHTTIEEDLYQFANLDINGSAVFLEDKELIDLIGEFMSALKKDEVFLNQFSEVKLISSQRRKFANLEVMDFKLFCQFK